MTIHISIELPESAFTVLQTPPEVFAKEMRLAASIKWYEIGLISESKAAELAGITHQAFIEALPRFKVMPKSSSEKPVREQIEPQQPGETLYTQSFIRKARGMLKGNTSLTQALLKARAEEREQEESGLSVPSKSDVDD